MHHNVSRFKSLDSKHNLQKSVVKVEANALITTAIAFIAICVYVLVLLLFIFYNFALDFLSLVYVCMYVCIVDFAAFSLETVKERFSFKVIL